VTRRGGGARVRLFALLSIALVVPLGFASKFYRGPGQFWFNNSLGGALYVMFWCLAVFCAVRRAGPAAIAAGVFVVTSALEVLQLWHPPLLERVRATFPGATLIGTTFAWTDFFYYAAGSVLGWAWMRALKRLG
jgi:hypothetical protein